MNQVSYLKKIEHIFIVDFKGEDFDAVFVLRLIDKRL